MDCVPASPRQFSKFALEDLSEGGELRQRAVHPPPGRGVRVHGGEHALDLGGPLRAPGLRVGHEEQLVARTEIRPEPFIEDVNQP